MAYGTATGVSYVVNVKNYNDWITLTAAGGGIDAAQVIAAIADADGMIDAVLAKVISPSLLPLSAPPRCVITTSNYLAACAIARSIFIKESVNDNNWISGASGICPTGRQMLGDLPKNPEILALIAGAVSMAPDSTTKNDDAIFTVERTQGGASVEDGTTTDW